VSEGFERFVVPDVIGDPVEGWRAWRMHTELVDGPVEAAGRVVVGPRPVLRLASVNQREAVWAPREKHVANCNGEEKHPDGSPEEGCQCGIHFLTEPLGLAKLGYASLIGEGKKDMVWGRVHGWGRIIEGSTGWKAQFAYPTELFIRKDARFEVTADGVLHELDMWACADVLAAEYGVPTTVISHVARPKADSNEIILIPLERDEA
jgi:hypothetical protein